VKAHETLIPLALFVLAFAGALFVLRQPGAVASDSAISAAHTPRAARTASAVRMVSTAPASGVASPLTAASAAPPSGATGSSIASVSATASPQSAAPRTAHADSIVPAGGEGARAEDGDAEESVPAPPAEAQRSIEAVGDAIDTLKYSSSSEDRVRAIRALATTARSGLEMARARTSLRVAAADENPDVAARAQEEYDALIERDDR
jgi:hypothetical protein